MNSFGGIGYNEKGWRPFEVTRQHSNHFPCSVLVSTISEATNQIVLARVDNNLNNLNVMRKTGNRWSELITKLLDRLLTLNESIWIEPVECGCTKFAIPRTCRLVLSTVWISLCPVLRWNGLWRAKLAQTTCCTDWSCECRTKTVCVRRDVLGEWKTKRSSKPSAEPRFRAQFRSLGNHLSKI